MKIDILDKKYEEKYEDFLLRSEKSLFFVSNKYRLFLKELLKAKDCYFLAVDDNDNITGALPAFLKENEKHGNVLNSLPFYGSNGGIIEYENNVEVKKTLLNALYDYAKENNCVSTTIITSPFEDNPDFYEENALYNYKDSRIGQLTPLPEVSDNIGDDLFKMFDGTKRTDIRKAIKHNLQVNSEYSRDSLEFLMNTHKENMLSINGTPKTEEFFEFIPSYFEYEKDYKIYTAFLSENPISTMLVFYYNKTAEYFCPAVVEEYRTYQGLSLLIFEAMKDAVKKDCKWWNWGGTWSSQCGVYDFKKKWGTQDFPYYYYVRVFDEKIKTLSKKTLLKEYPNFYVLPFSALKQ